jgi:hypothetical protein
MTSPQEPTPDLSKQAAFRPAQESSPLDPLDRLLDQARPLPDAPWFSTQVLARIRQAETRHTSWKGFFPSWLRPLPAICLVLLTGWGFFNLTTENQTAVTAKLELPPTAPVEEIVEMEDLDILLADLQMELWLNDPAL